jgi:hypothetical protein
VNPVLGGIALTLVSVSVLAIMTVIRWWLARSHWDHHPAGRRGYLNDVILMTATFAPMILAGLILRIELLSGQAAALMPYLYGGLLAAFAIRVVLRRSPPFSPANQRLTDSRMAALAAKASNSRKAD